MSPTPLSRDILNARLSTLFHEGDHQIQPHLAWYAYYRILTPDLVSDPARDLVTVECLRHNRTFKSKWRYLRQKGKYRPMVCPECHYEFDNGGPRNRFGWKYQDLVSAFNQRPELGFVLDPSNEIKQDDFIQYSQRFYVLCTHCHTKTKHNVNNLKTHLKSGDHLSCQHCERQRKGKVLRLSLQDAQQRLTRFDIDPKSYRGFASPALLTCRRCSQRHQWTPHSAESGQCVRCGANGAKPISLMPTLDDFDGLIRSTTTWQLATKPELISENQAVFTMRRALPPDAVLHVQCQRHPDKVRSQLVRYLHSKLRTQSCRSCSADNRRKYTAEYLEGLFSKRGITLNVDLDASGVAKRDSPISSDLALVLHCQAHGRLSKTYTTYRLIRYLREYRQTTPCPYCQSHPDSILNATVVRKFVESNNRWNTHEAIYELVQTDNDINAEITRLQSKGLAPYDVLSLNLRIKKVLHTTLGVPLHKPTLITMNYKNFKDGKKGFIGSKEVPPLTKFIEHLGHLWHLGLCFDQEFDELKGTNYINTLSIDFYQPQLRWAVDINTPPHSAENGQEGIHKKRYESNIDEYFKKRSDIEFISVPNYRKLSSGRYRTLSLPQQFDMAIDLCQRLYFALYGTLAPEIDKDALLTQSRIVTSDNAYVLQRLNKRYRGILTAQMYRKVEGRARIILTCRNKHAFEVSLTRAYQFHPSKLGKSGTLCWACQRQTELNIAKDKLRAIGWVLINEAELRSKYHGSIDDPIIRKGSKQKILLRCTHQDDANRSKDISLAQALDI